MEWFIGISLDSLDSLDSLFCAFDAFAWALPYTLFYVSCKLLVGLFENLENKITAGSPDIRRIESLRKEHSKLCETVALADKVFSPLMLAAVGSDVPLICINFYQLVKPPDSSKEDITFSHCLLLVYYSDCKNSLYYDIWSASQRKGKISLNV